MKRIVIEADRKQVKGIFIFLLCYFLMGFLVISFFLLTGIGSFIKQDFNWFINYWLMIEKSQDPPWLMLLVWPFVVFGSIVGGFS